MSDLIRDVISLKLRCGQNKCKSQNFNGKR